MKSSIKNRVIRALSPLGVSARVLVAVAFAGALVAACDVHGVSDPGTLATISVSPNATLAAASTIQMVAVGRDADGRVIPISPTWSVAGIAGAVNATGMFTAGPTVGVFNNSVVASVGAISGSASMTITPGIIATITVVPNPVTLAVTTKQQFIAVAKDAAGNIVNFTPTWSVVAGGGTMDSLGNFTAGNTPGTYTNTVQASNNAIKGFATVIVSVGPMVSLTVTPNPDTLIVATKQQFVAVGKDAGGNVIAAALVWSVAAGGGTIDGGGMFTAGATPGTFTNTVKATSGTFTATATVVVTAGPLATITVLPNPATMTINGVQQFTATGSDIAGNPVVIVPVWSVVANGGTISATGLFTAGTVSGTYTNTVRATSGSLSGFATVIVTTGPLASITVTPNPVTMPTNSTQQFVAVGKDASGNVFLMSPVWSVANGGGTINNAGLFTSGAVAGGFPNTIVATSGAISGNASVTVSAIPLATITVTPNPAVMLTNSTQQFVAVGKDAFGTVVVINPVWTVINGGGAISNTGLFTSGAVAGTFNNTVQATSGAISGTATVTVNAVAPPSPLLSAANFGILAGTGITCAISGTINSASTPSNIGSSPTLTISGFPPCTFTGIIPTPAVIAVAKGDLTAAYLAAQGQVCNLNLSGIDLGFYDGSSGAKTLPPGTYCFNTSAAITGTLKLTGSSAAKWTFQVGSTFNNNVGSQVLLAGGAIADNVYWAVGTSATLLTNSATQGNILALSSITLQNGATLLGRALAQNGAVDMTAGAATITKP